MDVAVLDTSVLLGVLDPNDSLHADARDAVRAERDAARSLVIPASVFAETLVGAHRQGPAVARRVAEAVDVLVDEVLPVCRDIADEAARLRAEVPAVRLPDALVIATGRHVDAAAVLTGDKRWRGVDSRIRLVVPGGSPPDPRAAPSG
ncbi:type II toxin-antitoxin system VapC family toxin [Streptomyces armeniacus]|uniref:Ribonuclease VapC n=1 Tax=Streptomyces armeniacus TaxID=83291 RepID=A0A345XR94_9ACTN|nr:PIN domain-containing protein [Streptomyces armeniacus]AXK34160.1 type II toxin-antitoxin system VapC family toxin [Streptomyces armeniacus]